MRTGRPASPFLAPAVVLLLLVVTAAASACGEHRPASPTKTAATVTYVVDGDTVRLEDGRHVRLVQIDAPELHGDCYGRAARRALARLLPAGARVVLVRDPGLDDVDAYGRLLRYVTARGRDVNLELVAAGAAQPYFFHGRRGRLAEALLAAARRARARRLGLWGACPGARLAPALGAVTGRA